MDVRTGTLRAEALFPNPRNFLRPGQFVRVRVLAGIRKGALLLPQRAVTELQGGYQVAVVGPDNRVAIRFVKPGEQVGSFWVIEKGISPGERVVAEGAQKVKQGEVVNPRPFAIRTTAAKKVTPPGGVMKSISQPQQGNNPPCTGSLSDARSSRWSSRLS